MQTDEKKLCPFSKAIIAKWCRCQYAVISDRCAGKMHCYHQGEQIQSCHALVDSIEKNSRFILGIVDTNQPLTHQQYMKVKCGGVMGMDRILNPHSSEQGFIPDIIKKAEDQYDSLDNFPFGEIIRDIADFSHRKSATKIRSSTR